jgi:hypothetical protein
MQSIKLDVFGRLVLAVQTGDAWKMYYIGEEGKRRPAADITVPADIGESDLEIYLADVCHEWCTTENPQVKRIP